jgi:Carboxypeptidase regulatory-like domain
MASKKAKWVQSAFYGGLSMRWTKRISAAFFGALLIVTCVRTLVAQSGAGSIEGTVTDATGAVIPGAAIHVVNDATGVANDTKSNDVGYYQVPELFTGHYTVTATAPGMETYKTSIDLLVAQAAVINPALTAGATTQQITVSANQVQLTTTENGAINSTLENDRINQLPMNVRLLLGLTGETTPGIVMGGGTQQYINGMAIEAGEYSVDGVPTSSDFYGGPYNIKIAGMDPDSVQEVRLETTSSGAQYSAPATAIVTTKSGTNSVHGTFFESARNNGWGIAKARQNSSNYVAPELIRNEFGANAGGPIVLPHVYHGKDKSFWFFAYERYSDASAASGLYYAPTPAMSQGDFSGLINDSGVLQVIMDPATTTNSASCLNPVNNTTAPNPYCRTAFSGNKIPIGRISPTAKVYYELIPPRPRPPTHL